MNDRELIELAAKAADVKGHWGEILNIGDDAVDMTDMFFVDDCENCSIWDPLASDGDAFRLAVNCNIAFGRSANTWWARWEFNDKVFRENAEKAGIQDHFAAARRAILRVAADIGKYHVKS